MKLKKFPVTSERGNIYLVKIQEDVANETLTGTIYEKNNSKYKLFKYRRLKGYISDLYKWRNDYIDFTKHIVILYEKEHFGRINRIDNWNNWDGKC